VSLVIYTRCQWAKQSQRHRSTAQKTRLHETKLMLEQWSV